LQAELLEYAAARGIVANATAAGEAPENVASLDAFRRRKVAGA
jgi:hypothetical protein